MTRSALVRSFAIAALLAAPVSAQPTPLLVEYLGNEGVLLRSATKKVLIDALFGDGLRGYPNVSEPKRSRLESAELPYRVDLLLATHAHGDHFQAAAVARHLEANPKALFVSTPDAIAQLEALESPPDPDSYRAVLPPPGEKARLAHRGIRVEAHQLHHGRARPEIQNLGFVVTIGGLRVLHVGDTEISLEEWEALGLAELDLALVPPWQVDAERRSLGYPSRHVAAFHLPVRNAPPSWFGAPATLDRLVDALKGEIDDLIVFTEPTIVEIEPP